MKLICKMLGGSHSYGLNTAQSDTDWRGVFVNTEVKHLVGLEKFEHQVSQNAEKDESFSEFRHTLAMLKNANTQMVELLYAKNWQLCAPEWQEVIKYRNRLVSSEKLYSCLKGYMQGELRLANGERTGKLGGKRKEAIDKYGFSPKNFVQLFRLAWAGKIYFEKGYFPVNVAEEEPAWAESLLDIKTHPERFDKERLNVSYMVWERNLAEAFENRKTNTEFDEDLANGLCLKVYGKIIAEAYLNSLDKKL